MVRSRRLTTWATARPWNVPYSELREAEDPNDSLSHTRLLRNLRLHFAMNEKIRPFQEL
jgi:hypothetical protein